LENIPFCYVKEEWYDSLLKNYRLKRNVADIEHGFIESTDMLGKQKYKSCSECIFDKNCFGVPKEYTKVIDFHPPVPIKDSHI